MKSNFIALIFTFFLSCSFAQNKTVLTVQTNKPIAQISPNMWGVFFEDINLGADGGLYAELVKNRSFEFAKPLMGWSAHSKSMMGEINLGSDFMIVNRSEMESTNPRFLRVKVNHSLKDSLGLTNEGFRGMGIKKGLRYDFSILYRQKTANVKLHLQLVNSKNEEVGTGVFSPNQTGDEWHTGEMSFTATATEAKAKMNIWFEGSGVIDLDMISLFPSDTWRNRKGGLRGDMVQMLAEMKPGFIRFPGGCIVEGRELNTRYQWKKTIGPIETRKLIINRWNNEIAGRPAPDYFQSFGLGFFEYFQLAEDIGAAPLPILNCGMACQFNTAEAANVDDLDPYIQDALDLVEFANGDVNTKWGKIRSDLGHPAPFNLKMIGVGNENWGPQYIERLAIFQKAIKNKYPDIKLICSSGFLPSGDLFNYLNGELRKMRAELIDEHYYSSPQWFLQNVKRYDNYDRNSYSKVFVGEYAAQSDFTTSPNNKNNWRTALCESAFLTGLERNADVVKMASYAPLFGNIDGWQWKPDLIWVDNLRVLATPNYHVQSLYANNKGTHAIPILRQDKTPVAGTDSIFASSVLDTATQELIIKITNVAGSAQLVQINIEGAKKLNSNAKFTVLHNDNLEAENSFDSPKNIAPVEKAIKIKGKSITTELLPYSLSVVRVKIS